MSAFTSRLMRWGPWLERAGVSCFAGFLAGLWVGLLLAEAGCFVAVPALLVSIGVGVLIWRLHRPSEWGGSSSAAHTGGLLAAIAVALCSLIFTLPPSEWIMGGWDPGVYIHTAGSLVREGTLRPPALDLAAMDAEARSQFGRQGREAWEPFVGMRMMPDGTLSPQFYHLYPVLMALAWPLGGVRAALVVNPLLNLVSILILYLWACRWVRPRWALAAALVLALNPAQVWQARFCTSELLTQCLLLGGLAMLGRALAGQRRDIPASIMAGAAFGLAMLTRYDAILFVVPMALILLVGWRSRDQRLPLFLLLGTAGALGGQSWLHQRFLASLYHPGGTLVAQGLLVAGLLAVAIVAVVTWAARRFGNVNSAEVTQPPIWLPIAGVVLFVAWVFLNWYVRPRLTVDGRILDFFRGFDPNLKDQFWFSLLAGRNARNFWYLQNLFGVPGLLAAVAGIGVLIFRARTVWRVAAVLAGLAVMAILMTFIYHEPFMMFASRRLVPAIIPLLCLGVAAAADSLESFFRARPRLGVAAAVLVLAMAVLVPLNGTLFMASHREWPGLIRWYDRLADSIPSDARVYSSQTGFAAPLRFLHGKRAYELSASFQNRPGDALAMLQDEARKGVVLWLTTMELFPLGTNSLVAVAELPLSSSILGSTEHAVPLYTRPRGGTFMLYRVLPSASVADRPSEGVNRARNMTD